MFRFLGLLSAIVFLSSCSNQVNFANQGIETPAFEIPSSNPPPVILPPPVIPPAPQIISKAGTCVVDQNEKILTCLDCQSTPATPAPPILSRKGQQLWDIMTAACSVENRSDPAGYVAPNREQLLARLIQCSPTLYPDTAYVGTQQLTIEALVSNPIAQELAFGSLYYNTASTDFETYFGLEIGEARYTFCRGQRSINDNGVYPIEYYNSLYDGLPFVLPRVWRDAQVIRNNLRNCMARSLSDPNVVRPPGQPGVTCSYESVEGEMSAALVASAQKWVDKQQKVYFEGFNQCGETDDPENLLDRTGFVKFATQVCK